MVATPTCFGISVSTSGGLLKQGTQVQHANSGTDCSHCHHQNIKILEYTKSTNRNAPSCDTEVM